MFGSYFSASCDFFFPNSVLFIPTFYFLYQTILNFPSSFKAPEEERNPATLFCIVAWWEASRAPWPGQSSTHAKDQVESISKNVFVLMRWGNLLGTYSNSPLLSHSGGSHRVSHSGEILMVDMQQQVQFTAVCLVHPSLIPTHLWSHRLCPRSTSFKQPCATNTMIGWFTK